MINWLKKKEEISAKNKNDYVSSCIINWVRSTSDTTCSGSSSEWTSKRIDIDRDKSWISFVVVWKLNFIFLIWNSTAVNCQTVE